MLRWDSIHIACIALAAGFANCADVDVILGRMQVACGQLMLLLSQPASAQQLSLSQVFCASLGCDRRSSIDQAGLVEVL
jgi:hypothetical protein